ncbi:hypothetical protein BRC78_00505 [Halobacteriales archaeon QH_8_68_33]|nr:MAG: hypothetical protein BRC78_00505 [Halobacteriales archaeon QH_8_68_33]
MLPSPEYPVVEDVLSVGRRDGGPLVDHEGRRRTVVLAPVERLRQWLPTVRHTISVWNSG